jgi:hypothetical protein
VCTNRKSATAAVAAAAWQLLLVVSMLDHLYQLVCASSRAADVGMWLLLETQLNTGVSVFPGVAISNNVLLLVLLVSLLVYPSLLLFGAMVDCSKLLRGPVRKSSRALTRWPWRAA